MPERSHLTAYITSILASGWWARKSGENNFTKSFPALDERVCSLHVRGVDGSQVSLQSALDAAGINQMGNLVEQATLFAHVGRLIAGPREHKLPVERYAL